MKRKNYLIKFSEILAKKIMIFIEQGKNRVFYKNKQISKIEYDLKKYYLKQIRPYSSINFYQSYPPLSIRGARPTLSRYLIYDLEKHLGKDKTVLDIGGNTGFFSLFVSGKVKEIDVLEIDKSFCNICKRLAKHEKINNVNVINEDFNHFNPLKKYDMIFSFAVHNHTKMQFEDYMNKLFSMLNKNGIILIESHPIGYRKEDKLKKSLEELNNVEIIKEGKLDDDGRLRTFFYVKKK